MLPLKIKIFLWLMLTNSILTKDNLLKRGWTQNDQCYFLRHKKTLNNLCKLAKPTWQVILCCFGLTRPPNSNADMTRVCVNTFPVSQSKLVVRGGGEQQYVGQFETMNSACFNKNFPDDHVVIFYSLTIGAFCRNDEMEKESRKGC